MVNVTCLRDGHKVHRYPLESEFDGFVRCHVPTLFHENGSIDYMY